MSATVIQQASDHQLRASLSPAGSDAHYHLLITRCDPRERRTEERVCLSALLGRDGLLALREVIEGALAEPPAPAAH